MPVLKQVMEMASRLRDSPKILHHEPDCRRSCRKSSVVMSRFGCDSLLSSAGKNEEFHCKDEPALTRIRVRHHTPIMHDGDSTTTFETKLVAKVDEHLCKGDDHNNRHVQRGY